MRWAWAGPCSSRPSDREARAARPWFAPAFITPARQEGKEGTRDWQRDGTDRYDPRVVGDEIAGCDVTSLVFIAADVEGELHGALWAELVTRAVLAQTRGRTLMPNPSQQETSSTSTITKTSPRDILGRDSLWNIASYPRCHHW